MVRSSLLPQFGQRIAAIVVKELRDSGHMEGVTVKKFGGYWFTRWKYSRG
jgi:hypothetical protein